MHTYVAEYVEPSRLGWCFDWAMVMVMVMVMGTRLAKEKIMRAMRITGDKFATVKATPFNVAYLVYLRNYIQTDPAHSSTQNPQPQ